MVVSMAGTPLMPPSATSELVATRGEVDDLRRAALEAETDLEVALRELVLLRQAHDERPAMAEHIAQLQLRLAAAEGPAAVERHTAHGRAETERVLRPQIEHLEQTLASQTATMKQQAEAAHALQARNGELESAAAEAALLRSALSALQAHIAGEACEDDATAEAQAQKFSHVVEPGTWPRVQQAFADAADLRAQLAFVHEARQREARVAAEEVAAAQRERNLLMAALSAARDEGAQTAAALEVEAAARVEDCAVLKLALKDRAAEASEAMQALGTVQGENDALRDAAHTVQLLERALRTAQEQNAALQGELKGVKAAAAAAEETMPPPSDVAALYEENAALRHEAAAACQREAEALRQTFELTADAGAHRAAASAALAAMGVPQDGEGGDLRTLLDAVARTGAALCDRLAAVEAERSIPAVTSPPLLPPALRDDPQALEAPTGGAPTGLGVLGQEISVLRAVLKDLADGVAALRDVPAAAAAVLADRLRGVREDVARFLGDAAAAAAAADGSVLLGVDCVGCAALKDALWAAQDDAAAWRAKAEQAGIRGDDAHGEIAAILTQADGMHKAMQAAQRDVDALRKKLLHAGTASGREAALAQEVADLTARLRTERCAQGQVDAAEARLELERKDTARLKQELLAAQQRHEQQAEGAVSELQQQISAMTLQLAHHEADAEAAAAREADAAVLRREIDQRTVRETELLAALEAATARAAASEAQGAAYDVLHRGIAGFVARAARTDPSLSVQAQADRARADISPPNPCSAAFETVASELLQRAWSSLHQLDQCALAFEAAVAKAAADPAVTRLEGTLGRFAPVVDAADALRVSLSSMLHVHPQLRGGAADVFEARGEPEVLSAYLPRVAAFVEELAARIAEADRRDEAAQRALADATEALRALALATGHAGAAGAAEVRDAVLREFAVLREAEVRAAALRPAADAAGCFALQIAEAAARRDVEQSGFAGLAALAQEALQSALHLETLRRQHGEVTAGEGILAPVVSPLRPSGSTCTPQRLTRAVVESFDGRSSDGAATEVRRMKEDIAALQAALRGEQAVREAREAVAAAKCTSTHSHSCVSHPPGSRGGGAYLSEAAYEQEAAECAARHILPTQFTSLGLLSGAAAGALTSTCPTEASRPRPPPADIWMGAGSAAHQATPLAPPVSPGVWRRGEAETSGSRLPSVSTVAGGAHDDALPPDAPLYAYKMTPPRPPAAAPPPQDPAALRGMALYHEVAAVWEKLRGMDARDSITSPPRAPPPSARAPPISPQEADVLERQMRTLHQLAAACQPRR